MYLYVYVLNGTTYKITETPVEVTETDRQYRIADETARVPGIYWNTIRKADIPFHKWDTVILAEQNFPAAKKVYLDCYRETIKRATQEIEACNGYIQKIEEANK